jgi:ribosomal-protein-alanine N-acetyltransferase
MTHVEICKLNASHINNLVYINTNSFQHPWSKESFLSELTNKFSHYIGIKINDELVGYIGIWLIIDEAHITNLAVTPDYRGRGLASKLLKATLKLCYEEKIDGITLEVRKSNIAARNLYIKFGFEEEAIRKNYYENGEDAIIMWKKNCS